MQAKEDRKGASAMERTLKCSYPLFALPRSVTRYEFRVGDRVHLRYALGKLNGDVIQYVQRMLGPGPFTAIDVDTDYVCVKNEEGKNDVVHTIWLLPVSVSHEEDYPTARLAELARKPAAAPG